MSRKHGHRDRGPPQPDQVTITIDTDEVRASPDLVVVDPGLVLVGADAVVVDPDEVRIAPEIVLVRCDPKQLRKRGPRSRCPCLRLIDDLLFFFQDSGDARA